MPIRPTRWAPTMADIAGIVPEVAEQFGVPPRQAEAGDNAQSRFRLFDAVTGFWRRASQRAPLLLIFEDLHFADATSLRLFGFLANELDDSRLLVLGTYRDTELSRQHPLLETLAELARSLGVPTHPAGRTEQPRNRGIPGRGQRWHDDAPAG